MRQISRNLVKLSNLIRNLGPNMVPMLVNEPYCIMHCGRVCEQNSIVDSVRVGDWTAEWVIIASNACVFIQIIKKAEIMVKW